MFELKRHHELLQLLTAGASFSLKASLKPHHELLQLAAAAKNGGGRLTLAGLGLRQFNELLQISAAGKGSVSFEE
jgi:hypothetical protein